MARYHVNPETGNVGECHASIETCPYIHGGTAAEARHRYEEARIEEVLVSHRKVQQPSRRFSFASSADALRRIPLKEMNAPQLAQTLRHETVRNGMDEVAVDSAISLATILHANQRRGNRGGFSSTPYIEHPLRNALRIIRLDVRSQDITIAAVLHDTVEDGSREYVKRFENISEGSMNGIQMRDRLRRHIDEVYGENVLELVDAVTNDYMADEDRARLPVEEKNRRYLEHVRSNIHGRPGVLIVKLSDFIDNATGLYHNNLSKDRKGTLRRAVKYLPLVEVFRKEIREQGESLPMPERRVSEVLAKMDRTEHRLKAIIDR